MGAIIMSMTRIVTACALLLVLLLPAPVPAKDFSFQDIKTNKYNRYLDIYDYLLPSLVFLYLMDMRSDSHDRAIEKVVEFVNFYSTPSMFQQYEGLGSDSVGVRNLSLMLASGNMFCSEQAYLGAQALQPIFQKLAYRDVRHHTFFEVARDDHWYIVDPMFDMRIRNRQGQIASFEDIQSYLAGDREALQLPDEPSPRTKTYLALFPEKVFTAVRHPFGGHIEMPRSVLMGLNPNFDAKVLEEFGPCSIEEERCWQYLQEQSNKILVQGLAAKDPVRFVQQVQDFFLDAIASELEQGISDLKGFNPDMYRARQLQLFGRHEQALEILEQLEQTEQVKFYAAQCYFLGKDEELFVELAEALKENIFYRYMYHQLTGSWLLKSDPETMPSFGYRLMDSDLR
jgi:hypothetical protein